MRALRYGNRKVWLDENTEKPIPAPGETLIRVRMAGICRTDLEIAKGYMAFDGTLGHEFAGIVDSPSTVFRVGARVVGEINAACGQCDFCRKGWERHCPHRTVLGIFKRNGCLADWCVLPEKNLYPVPDSVPDESAVWTELLAAVLEIFEQVHIEPTQSVCVVGDGKLGLLVSLVLADRQEGHSVLIGHHASKLKIVSDRLETILEPDVPASWNKAWDVVIETSGSTEGLKRAMALVRPRGWIVLKSTPAYAEPLDLTPLVIDEITVIGSRCGRFEPALRRLSRNRLPLQRLVEAVYPFDQVETAWEKASARGALKVLLRIS